MSPRHAWRQNPISLKRWMRDCKASSHVRLGDKLVFSYSPAFIRERVVSCMIANTNVFLGSYFVDAVITAGTVTVPAGTGWNHA